MTETTDAVSAQSSFVDVTNTALTTQLSVIKLTIDDQLNDIPTRTIVPRTVIAVRKVETREKMTTLHVESPSGNVGLLSLLGFVTPDNKKAFKDTGIDIEKSTKNEPILVCGKDTKYDTTKDTGKDTKKEKVSEFVITRYLRHL